MRNDIEILGFWKIGRTPFRIVVAISAIVMLFFSLTSTVEATSSKVIKIGGTLPLSGPAAGDGQRILEGRKLAVEKINEDGGVLGAKLELVIQDDGMDASRVASMYENLIRSEKVDIILPTYGAPMTTPAMVVAEKYDKFMVSAYSASTALLDKYGGKNFFTIETPSKEKGSTNWCYQLLTDFLWDFDSWNYKPGFARPKTIAVLNENQIWGIEQSKVWTPYAENQGWKIVLNEFVEMGQMEFSSIISKIKRLKPDVILAEFFYFRCIPFVKQLREQGVTANFVAMSESGTSMDWCDSKRGAGSKLGNGIITFAYVPKTYHEGGSDDFRKRFKTKFNRAPGYLEATGYANIQVVAQAIKQAGSKNTDDMRRALQNGQFKTCFTPCKFNSRGENEQLNPIVGQWINDELENVWPKEMQTHKPIYPYAIK